MASSSSAGLDAFYQEVGFHLGLPTNTIQLKMQQEMRGFTAKDLKLILQLLKDRYREILGYNHDELLVSGSRQQLVERLTRFLSGTGMQTLMENGGFSTSNQPSAGRSSSSGGHATRGATTRASSSAAAARSGEEEVICLLSDSEEEQQQGNKEEEEEEEEEEDDDDDDDDEYESEEEEYTERRRRGRRRLSTHRQAARPPAPPPPPALAHAYQPHQQPPGYLNPMHPPAHNPALLAFLAGNGMGFMPGPGGQYNPALAAAAAFGRGGGGLPQGAMGGLGPMGVPMGMPMGLGAMGMGGLGMGGMMMGEPKRSSAGGGGGPPSPPGKKARGSNQAGGGAASSVEVKEEKVDPYRAMNPTREEQRLVGQMMLESGIPAAESLTALRASNWEIDKAIQWFVSALDMDVTEIQSLAQASIESEAINDNRKKAERLQMDELRYSGDVVASNLFEESVILNERQGSKAVRLFVREHCTASPSSPSSSGDPPAAPPVLRGPMAERRNHVVRILMWEKQGIRCYKDPARAYVRQLIQRLDEPLVRAGATAAQQQQQPGTGGGDDEGRWERLMPLALVSREADALQACIVDYPQGNTGGVPPLFLEAQGRAADLDRDGVQLMEVLDQGSSSSTHHHVHTSAAAPGKGGSRRSSGAPVECIELVDDD